MFAQGQRENCQWAQVQPFAELLQLIESDTRPTSFQFGQVGAAGGVGKFPLSDISHAAHCPQYLCKRRLERHEVTREAWSLSSIEVQNHLSEQTSYLPRRVFAKGTCAIRGGSLGGACTLLA